MIDIAPWEMDAVIAIWNEHAAKALGWRIYTDGKAGSRPRSLRRLGVILDKSHTTVEAFKAELLVALIYIQQQGAETVNRTLGSRYDLRMTFWTFIRDLNNVRTLADAALNRTPAVIAQQQDWRQQKRQLLEAFKADVAGFIETAVYRSGSDLDKLQLALHAARTGLVNAEDLLSGN